MEMKGIAGILGFFTVMIIFTNHASAIAGGFFPAIPDLEDTDFESCSFFCVLASFDCIDLNCGELEGDDYDVCADACFDEMLDCYEDCEEEYSWCEDLGYILPGDCPSTGSGGGCSSSDCRNMGFILPADCALQCSLLDASGGGGFNESESIVDNWCFGLNISPCLLILILIIIMAVMGGLLYWKSR